MAEEKVLEATSNETSNYTLPEDTVLSVQNLTVSFKTPGGMVRAVRDVSFDLKRGETLCIVGESGSGKSVTSRTIMGILAGNGVIDGGHIYYNGIDLTQAKEEDFYKIRGSRSGKNIIKFKDGSMYTFSNLYTRINGVMLGDRIYNYYGDLVVKDYKIKLRP